MGVMSRGSLIGDVVGFHCAGKGHLGVVNVMNGNFYRPVFISRIRQIPSPTGGLDTDACTITSINDHRFTRSVGARNTLRNHGASKIRCLLAAGENHPRAKKRAGWRRRNSISIEYEVIGEAVGSNEARGCCRGNAFFQRTRVPQVAKVIYGVF